MNLVVVLRVLLFQSLAERLSVGRVGLTSFFLGTNLCSLGSLLGEVFIEGLGVVLFLLNGVSLDVGGLTLASRNDSVGLGRSVPAWSSTLCGSVCS